MPTVKIGEQEFDTAELAQIGKSAFEALGPVARLFDVPGLAPTKADLDKIDRDFAEMAHSVIALYLAKKAGS